MYLHQINIEVSTEEELTTDQLWDLKENMKNRLQGYYSVAPEFMRNSSMKLIIDQDFTNQKIV